MKFVIPQHEDLQPPTYSLVQNEVTVAIASLSIGGAERIVLDWAARIYPRFRVHLIVLYDRPNEWPVPDFVRVTRLNDKDIVRKLEELGRTLAQSVNPVCVCHLFRKVWRDALTRGGAQVVTVLHNAKDGWEEGVDYLAGTSQVIAVSDACRRDLREQGWKGPVSVIRHIPPRWKLSADARERYRREWNVPKDALVIGMIGAVKPQKNYVRALEVFKEFLGVRDAYLVILGGPVNMSTGRETWEGLVNAVYDLGLRSRVALPGFVPAATKCVPAFDVMLNTSHFEGLSIATLEVLVNGMPIVASAVGGQGEIGCDGLTLIAPDSDNSVWVDALIEACDKKFDTPSWANFPSFRLWTLAGLARPFSPIKEKVLFVTENLNSGGAQRSLVNLAMELSRKMPIEISVSRRSSTPYFLEVLRTHGIPVLRPDSSGDVFAYAESLVERVCMEKFGTVCFWNCDPKLKLLLLKALGFTSVRFVDVSPGGYAFAEMDDIPDFAKLIAFTGDEYYTRLDQLVLKYGGDAPESCRGKTTIIRNGVPHARHPKRDYALSGIPRVVVSGRIAPSKFILEILETIERVRTVFPKAELHVYGGAEKEHSAYAETVAQISATHRGQTIFHGVHFSVMDVLKDYDAYVVLGEKQGCPNALLEALAVGMPSIANDDGGTREQIKDGVTGLLVDDTDPSTLAEALIRILSDRCLAERLGTNGRLHVAEHFAMRGMSDAYEMLFRDKKHTHPAAQKRHHREVRHTECAQRVT